MALQLDLARAKAELQRIASSGDALAALRYLNDLTPHRYTALNVFHDPTCINLYGVDKRRPEVYILFDLPITATYCSLIRRSQVLEIPDAMTAEALLDHPARRHFRSYLAVPLVDQAGEVFGTVCHFDRRPLAFSPETVALLEFLGPHLTYYAHEERTRLLAPSLN